MHKSILDILDANKEKVDPTFQQNLPDNPKLVKGDKLSGQLLYENTVTGLRYLVPNVWYNQPVERRVDAMRFYAKRHLACAVYWDNSTAPCALLMAKKMKASAERCNALADEMEDTGEVLA